MTFVAQNQNQWRVDVSADGGTTWYQVIGITSSNFPGLTAGLKDSSSYDNNGWGSQTKTSMSWSLEIDLLPKAESGAYAQSYQILNAAQLAFGDAGNVQARWGRTDGLTPFEGYTGTGIVSKAPGNTNWDDLRSEKFTLAGAGEAVPLTSAPAAWSSTASPQIASVDAGAVGSLVTVHGSGFTGATGVSFGATAAPEFDVVSDSVIEVEVPSGVTGTVSVTVTTPAGTSPGFSWTVS